MSGTKSDAGNLSQAKAVVSPEKVENAPAVGRDSLIDDFWKSYVDAGVSSPYNGVGQLVNAASRAVSDRDALAYAPHLASPKESLGLGGKIAEYAGQFAGMATDVALLTLAMRAGASSFLREGATAESVSLFGKTMRPAALATAEATIAGAAYQGIFQPSADGANLLPDRLKSAAIGGLSYGSFAWLGQTAAPIMTRFFVPSLATKLAPGALDGATGGEVANSAARGAETATVGSDPIGVAYMDAKRVLNIRMRLEAEGTMGDVHLQYRPSHPQYGQIAKFLGNLKPDEGVQLTKWPFLPGGGVKS
jgi:hypothetical protein